ncbi:MAG: sigma 54-interacting transcriptional regulator [Candidatus Cloacimonetes bacterium]|nr:sigma 54-interacting transcriptional regulator [Candidatus Cloacimonadota bacterium]
MINSINETLASFSIQKNKFTSRILTEINYNESKIIEIIGNTGSGKSFNFQRLKVELQKRSIDFNIFIPKIFRYNQVKDIIHKICDISMQNLNKLFRSAVELNLTNRYDLFYYLTENLSQKKCFKSTTLIIYECSSLDRYSLDFIQYLVQYNMSESIIFITFTRQETFPFSLKLNIEIPSKEDIIGIIKTVFPSGESDFQMESEIICSISKGNLFVIRHILENFLKEKGKIDLEKYLEKKINLDTIYKEKIKNISQEQLNLLYTIFFFDTKADVNSLKKILGSSFKKKNLESLQKKDLIFMVDDKYLVKKVSSVQNLIEKLSTKDIHKIVEPITNILDKSIQTDFLLKMDLYEKNNTNKLTDYLKRIYDYPNLISIYKKIVTKQKKHCEKLESLRLLGIYHTEVGENEKATDYFRDAMKLCIKYELPMEDTVYYLAKSLVAMNSSTFALEIIKKYSPITIQKEWKWKLIMLKAKILMENEQFDDAKSEINQAKQITSMINDRLKRNNMRAETKKMSGLISYYNNELTNAKKSFEEAEELYKITNNIEGLAAIYNNLGGISIFRGKWKDTKTLFKKSLKLEKERYNLNGISFCYNNLGSLWGDQNNYEKAIFYLNEALKIQKLLSDSYQISTFHFNIGLTYKDHGEYEKAIESLNQSLQIAVNFKLYKSVDAALNAMGAIYFKSGNWTKAIEYYKDAIEKSKKNNFSLGMCESYNNLGELYEKRGEYNLAFDYYQKSNDILSNISDDFLKAVVHGNIGSVLTMMHKYREAYGYLIESHDFFKNIEANVELTEASQKLAYYFMSTRNIESADYHLKISEELATETNDEFRLGRAYYLRALLENKNSSKAISYLEKASEIFVKTNNNFDLAISQYEFASLLFQEKDWEQALQILHENRKIIKRFNAINLLEKNDLLIQKIKKKYEKELKESRQQDSMLNDFYEITQFLNSISVFDTLLNQSLDRIVDFADANGGVFCLYNNQLTTDSWEYVLTNNFSVSNHFYPEIMNVIQECFDENVVKNIKQPQFAPEFNNIIAFPLSIRNEKMGVICLFIKGGSYYFSEKMMNLINALCNQIVVIIENISFKSLEQSHAVIREELASTNLFTNIIGKSLEIQKIFKMIDKIKDTPTTILLEGPSGTGKELIARAIHFTSNRRNKRFVAQYCGALPETLLESELFGHIKGAFTGASQDKKGLFEIANGGTFFLDEIGDVSLSTQAKLLRFLQEGEIKRVGSTITENVDVRVICATNVNLRDKVKNGDFREDLFYRLNVIRIDVPSLDKRKSDIPLLTIHFLDKYCAKINKHVNGITDEAMKYLISYKWPGNIRQLENEIERAVTLADADSYIKASDLSEEIFHYSNIKETINLLDDIQAPANNDSMKEAVEKLEIQMIRQALEETGWNQTQAAKKLKLSRQGLIKKLHRYNLEK